MDPDLEVFLRRPAQQLKLLHSASIDDTINCCAVSTDDQQPLIAVAQADTAAILLFSEALTVLRELAGHPGGTNALSFSSTGKLVSAGEDGIAAVWDPSSGDLLARLECEGENVDRCYKICQGHQQCRQPTAAHSTAATKISQCWLQCAHQQAAKGVSTFPAAASSSHVGNLLCACVQVLKGTHCQPCSLQC